MSLLSAARDSVDVAAHVDNVDDTSEYKRRQAAGQCCRPGCSATPADGSDLCEEHHADKKARNRRFMRAARKRWRAKKLCSRCGRRRRPGKSYCARCLIQRAKTRKLDVAGGVDKSQRVAARLIAWTNSPQNTGRTRLRGGTKGRPPIAAENRLDVEDVQKNVVTAVDALRLADSPELEGMPPIQKQDTRQAAGAWWLLIARQALVLAKRNGCALPLTTVELLGEIGDSEDESET